MKAPRMRKPSLALIISLIALFVSLGGTSYAAIVLPANSVGSTQLKTAAVTGAKIKNSAVTANKIASGAVTTDKIAAGAVTAAKITTTGLTVPHATAADGAPPTGSASGALAGSYPSPTLAAGSVSDTSFSGSGATCVAEAGGTIIVSGTTPTVNASFDRLSSTAMSVTRTAVGSYTVTIPGMNYVVSQRITQIAMFNVGAAFIGRVDSLGGNLILKTVDMTGTAADPLGFSFVIYK
jgi:hypothetical protein